MAYGLWQAPKKGRRYLMGIDPNFGGKDNFVAQVWDCTESPVALVAEYAEADRTIETSVESVARLIEDYGPEIVAVESNSGGRIVLEQLIRLFPSVRIEGVTTTSASKKVNTDRIALAIESREVTYPADWQGLNEMMHFGLMERAALSGKDDRVMAMAAAWVFFHELDPKGRARKRGQWLKRI
jgi:phage terminase large subunit-like protein